MIGFPYLSCAMHTLCAYNVTMTNTHKAITVIARTRRLELDGTPSPLGFTLGELDADLREQVERGAITLRRARATMTARVDHSDFTPGAA